MINKITSVVLFFPFTAHANAYVDLFKEETPSLWLSLFALAIISMISLYLSSEKLKELDIKYLMLSNKEKEIEKKQQMILEFMSGKIETSTKGIIQSRKEFSTHLQSTQQAQINPSLLKEAIGKFEESEAVLLDATHELVDFLKLKSDTLELKDESYTLNNVINETFSVIHETVKNTKTELVYDIDPMIANSLRGDSRRLEQILATLCNDAMNSTLNATLLMHVSKTKRKHPTICVDIYNPKRVLPQEEIKTLLENYSLKEEYKSSDKLYMFIAYKLIKLMGGTLEIHSDVKKGTHYIMNLPYVSMTDKTDEKEIQYEGKRFLVAVENQYQANVFKKRLSERKIDVELVDESLLVNLHHNLESFDAVIVDKQWVNFKLINELNKRNIESVFVLKHAHDSVNNMNENTSYHYMFKPLQNRQIDTILETTFQKKETKHPKKEINAVSPSANNNIVLKDRQGITPDSFKVFSHLHILIVEDNIMNQKILKGLFSKSGMCIFIANNGLEALDLVKSNSEIDLIFMDTNMPVMDGYEASKQIRLFRNKKMLPIIGIDSIGFANRSENSSAMNAFLHKPFKIGQIYSALIQYTSLDDSSVKFIAHKLSKYEPNKKVLDIHKGISQANTAIFYKETLKESLHSLSTAKVEIEECITYQKYKELKSILLDTIRLSEIIGATGLRRTLLEMVQTFDYNQQNKLGEYIFLFNQELSLLKNEIEEYLKT